jgi:hypothetical protein
MSLTRSTGPLAPDEFPETVPAIVAPLALGVGDVVVADVRTTLGPADDFEKLPHATKRTMSPTTVKTPPSHAFVLDIYLSQVLVGGQQGQ